MRVGIVNDLALAREALRRVVLSCPAHSVAWMAEDGAQAVRLARADRPDAVLMDLVMPVMDGVEATRRIMEEAPCPILLVTSSVGGRFALVAAAMGYGAIDAVNTPTLGTDGIVRGGERLLDRLLRMKLARRHPKLPVWATAPRSAGDAPLLVALGASTGGPEALARVLEGLPAGFPAAVTVVQHLGADFIPNFASWLGTRCRLPVEVARAGSKPRAGIVSIACTDDHLTLSPALEFRYSREPAAYPFRPSVDVFFQALAALWPRPGAAVLLTGMGDDGAAGLLELRQASWLTLAQDEATCAMYGMPRAAAERGAASHILPLGEIAGVITARLGAK